MAKRTDTKFAVLIQVMGEMGFDRETIARVTKVPQRTVSDIANWKGCWASRGEFNELRGVGKGRRLHNRFEHRQRGGDASIKNGE
jgi:hypothetical protein